MPVHALGIDCALGIDPGPTARLPTNRPDAVSVGTF